MKPTTTIAAAALAAAAVMTTAPAATAATAATCSEHVSPKIDWLRVHKGIKSKAVVGQIPGGACFHEISINKDPYWAYGYGYNGSVKVKGYVDADYLV